jgi:polyisoprenoid-binding protein YceI
VRYTIRETNLGTAAVHEVVGVATGVSGRVLLDSGGVPVRDQSQITLDLRTLRTDQLARDEVLQATTLDTQQYPTSQFSPTSIEGLGTWPAQGNANFRVCGQLSLHGSQHPFCLGAVGQFTPDAVSGTASAELSLSEFGIAAPQLGPLLAIDDRVSLEMEFRAQLIHS